MSHATAGGPDVRRHPGPTSRGTPEKSGGPGRAAGGGGASLMRTRPWLAAAFLLPALLLLAALVVYPIGYSVFRSLFDASGSGFVGLDNYAELFSDNENLTAVKNTLIWVVVAPSVATALGLIFAVLTERVRWGTAFKLIVFMPMAISMLAAGIIFRLVYEQDPDRGVANAVWVGVHDTFAESSAWPGARPRPDADLARRRRRRVHHQGRRAAPATRRTCRWSASRRRTMAGAARGPAGAPRRPGELTGTVWLDFTKGGGGEADTIDPAEKALPASRSRPSRAARWSPGDHRRRRHVHPARRGRRGDSSGCPRRTSPEAYGGVDWLGPSLVTPAIIASYVWMWAGFAMVLIAAGLAGVPRELLEAARVDGASEWQVFRRVTVPLLAPVLAVVLVTLMINVLKIFDLVYIIAPGATQSDATVLALQLYQTSFGSDTNQGVGSAIAVVLLLLVVPVMVFNIRRLRRENSR